IIVKKLAYQHYLSIGFYIDLQLGKKISTKTGGSKRTYINIKTIHNLGKKKGEDYIPIGRQTEK
ncbi:hypothetical protein PP707_05855, partial [Acetobacter pasteurianus]|nr:hypothetical protein [Acetobacter pasteurianus]